MTRRPTYEELDQRVKELEKEADKREEAEEELRKYQFMIESAHDAIFFKDLGSRYISANNKTLEVFGLSREDVIGKNDYELMPDQKEAKKNVHDDQIVFKSGKPTEVIKHMTGADGKGYWFQAIKVPLFDNDGKVIGLVGIARDITKLKQAEEALRESEEKYRSLFENTGTATFVTEEDMTVSQVNAKCEVLSGYSRDEIVGKMKTTDFIPVEELERIKKYHFERRKKDDNIPPEYELKLVDKNGNIKNVFIQVGMIPKTKQSIASIIDITPLKQAEKALRESEERYKSLFKNNHCVMLLIDPESADIVDANPAAVSFYGWSKEELTSKKITNINTLTDEQVFQEMKQAKTEERQHFLFSHRLSNGEIRDVEVYSRPIILHGKQLLYSIIHDISERKKAEKDRQRLQLQLQQAHKMEAIGTMAGGIAHDFNNILGIILGNTELAMDDVPEWNPARMNLDEVRTASLRAKDVVRQLLSFARKTDQERKPVKINSVITGALKLLRSSIPTSIEMRCNMPRDSEIILADPTQTNQIMINLCTNAAQAMEDDGGILEISLESVILEESIAKSYELSPGRFVKLTVNDTGHGIDPKIKDRIFDPYFTTREVGKGSGMGLAVVHGIVKNHDGAISVDSEVGKGTTFNVLLPIVRREPVPEIIIDEDLPIGKELILYVDDEESIVKMGNQRLERLGYKVESTTSPIEALDLFRSKPDQFDLVITDLTMPKMTGDKLVKEILNIRLDMPIIICTGFSEKMDGEKARAVGALGYLEKPHEKRDLAKMVRKVLDGK
jgi:PAS domain S-box-containing protein